MSSGNLPIEIQRFIGSAYQHKPECRFCNQKIPEGICNGWFFYERCGLCYRCARVLFGLFNHAHSGELGLDWPRLHKNKTPYKRRHISTKRALDVFARDNYKCKACGTSDNLSVDHIKPISKGGANEECNLQTLCKSCNSRKHARWEAEVQS